MANQDIFTLLQQNDRIWDSGGYSRTVDFNLSHSVVYFKGVTNYKQLDTANKGEISDYLSNIVRIERQFEGETHPIWTIEDGIISQNEKFVRLHGKFYTIKFLEELIDKIKEIKNLNI